MQRAAEHWPEEPQHAQRCIKSRLQGQITGEWKVDLVLNDHQEGQSCCKLQHRLVHFGLDVSCCPATACCFLSCRYVPMSSPHCGAIPQSFTLLAYMYTSTLTPARASVELFESRSRAFTVPPLVCGRLQSTAVWHLAPLYLAPGKCRRLPCRSSGREV